MQEMQKELQMIQELMQELQEKMSYGKEDFEERLGRGKPHVEVMKLEGQMPGMDPLEKKEDEVDDQGSEEMSDDMSMDSEDDKLKNRLMKLRA